MRRLPPTAAEDLLGVFVRRHEKGAIILTINRPLEDWGQVLGDIAVPVRYSEALREHLSA